MILATVLFFAGISTKMRLNPSQNALIVLAGGMLLWRAYRFATLPVPRDPLTSRGFWTGGQDLRRLLIDSNRGRRVERPGVTLRTAVTGWIEGWQQPSGI